MFLDILRSRFAPTKAADLDATIEFNWHYGACRVSVEDREATFFDDMTRAPEADFVMFFRDEAQAKAIILGQADPVAAFMAGEFRSSGHLIMVFQTLTAFSGS